ncbi:MAG: hypothetical protein V7K32_13010 [Nostoc sp.]|uniref:hypothetical protein n=1 Tax=Nostoc sp. TaxID=1180 RepID=UPI002FF614F5
MRGVRIVISNLVADSAIAYRSSLTLKLILELILQCSITWWYLSRNSSPSFFNNLQQFFVSHLQTLLTL